MKQVNTKPGVGPLKQGVEEKKGRMDTEPSASVPANVDEVLDGLSAVAPPTVVEQAQSEGAEGARYAAVAVPAKSVLPEEQAEGAVIIAMTEPLPTLPTPVQALEPDPVVINTTPRRGIMIEETVPAAHRRRAVRRKVLSLIAMATVLSTTFAIVLVASRDRRQPNEPANASAATTTTTTSAASVASGATTAVVEAPSASVAESPPSVVSVASAAPSAPRQAVAPVVPVTLATQATSPPTQPQPHAAPVVKTSEPKATSPASPPPPAQPATHEPPPKSDALRNL